MTTFILPPVLRNEDGNLRTVGFELEYGGLNLQETAALIVDLYGGRHVEESRYVHRVEHTTYGTFRLEVDALMLKKEAYAPYFEQIGIDVEDALYVSLEDVLERVATTVVPYEISTPPIPITELDALEQLRAALHEHHAEGTRSSVIHAFGMHINPEVPALDAGTLLNYLRAFLLLYDWLVEVSHIDFSRRLTSFIDPFPKAYVRLVCHPSYGPDVATLAEDYMTHNPTRNRPLDLLPLFAYLDEAQVRQQVGEDTLIKPRPTLHYRFPNSLIDEADWRIATAWNHCVEVEKLAQAPRKITAMSTRYLEVTDQLIPDVSWADEVTTWIR